MTWGKQVGGNTAQAGYKILEIWIGLEYLGPEADLKASFGVKDETGAGFVKIGTVSASMETPFDIMSWISDYLRATPSDRHFTSGEVFDSVMLTFAGREDAQELNFYFMDAPPIDVLPFNTGE